MDPFGAVRRTNLPSKMDHCEDRDDSMLQQAVAYGQALLQKNEELQSELQALTNERDHSVAQLKAELRDKQQHLSETQQRVEELDDMLAGADDEKRAMNALLKQQDTTQAAASPDKNSKASRELGKCLTELLALKKQLMEAQEKIHSADAMCEDKAATIRAQEVAIQKLADEKDALTAQLGHADSRCEELEKQLQAARQEKQRGASAAAQLELECEDLRGANEQLRNAAIQAKELEIQLRDEILSKSTQIASLHERTYQLDELVESMQNLASTGSLEDLNKSAEPAPDIQNLGQDRRGHSVSANASGAGAHDVEAGGTDRALPSEHEEERLPIEIKLAVLKSTLQAILMERNDLMDDRNKYRRLYERTLTPQTASGGAAPTRRRNSLAGRLFESAAAMAATAAMPSHREG